MLNYNDKQKELKKAVKKAAAIKYEAGDSAPTVIAKGKGLVADNILDKADESDIPVYKDEALVEELTKIDLGEFIPPELYNVVAEIMIFVSDLDKLKDKM